MTYKLPPGKSLGLKVVLPGGRPESPYAPKGFRWNLTPGGETEAPDWNSKPECGGGLHLWTWGQGDLHASSIWYRSDVLWMVVEYETSKAVDLGGKVKVPKCRTIAVSSERMEVVAFIQEHTPFLTLCRYWFERLFGAWLTRQFDPAGDVRHNE